MTARRLRESPRMIAAGVVSAAVLILVGVLIGSATGGGSSSNQASQTLRHRNASQAAQLQSAAGTITGLRTRLAAAVQSLGVVHSQLTTVRARARCWRTAALHHGAGRVPNCAAQT